MRRLLVLLALTLCALVVLGSYAYRTSENQQVQAVDWRAEVQNNTEFMKVRETGQAYKLGELTVYVEEGIQASKEHDALQMNSNPKQYWVWMVNEGKSDIHVKVTLGVTVDPLERHGIVKQVSHELVLQPTMSPISWHIPAKAWAEIQEMK